MENKNTINKPLNLQNSENINKIFENKELSRSNSNVNSLTSNAPKSKEYTSSTSIWNNSIYSFNQNYIKNIPSVDNIVNKMIKGFFSINALDNNVNGKKLKLSQRRYKKLSLNKILISKSEIKHNNNKVYITIYLFNKKKTSLLLNLNKAYNKFRINILPNLGWKKNNFEKLASNLFSEKLSKFSMKNYEQNFSKPKYKLDLKKLSGMKKMDLSKILDNKNKISKFVANVTYKRYGFISMSNTLLNSREYNNIKNTKKTYQNNLNQIINNKLFENKILYYNRLSSLTKFNLFKYLNTLQLNKSIRKNYILISSPSKIFPYTNQYKLYNNNLNHTLENNYVKLTNNKNKLNILGILNITNKNKGLNLNTNHTIFKLKSVHKLFRLYNNFIIVDSQKPVVTKLYTRKLLLNTYKLLKKNYGQELSYNKKNKQIKDLIINNKSKYLINNTSLQRNKFISTKHSKTDYNINVKRTYSRLIKMNIFFDKYKENLKLKNIKSNTYFDNLKAQIINKYKMEIVNYKLEKELLYVYYLKLLTYNNAIFKSWFLYPLKLLLSKIYNKKVILNLVNLKYIHLNSDIFTEAVNIRLRNFKRNNVVNVLKRAIKLVTISQINVFARNQHNNKYKYLQNYYAKFKHLKLDIFNELYLTTSSLGNENSRPLNSNLKNKTQLDIVRGEGKNKYNPCVIKRLNHIQSSTINFIKFKSVFGARLEAAGRLTKRSTASRALFKFRYKGTLKNNPAINTLSTTIIKNNQISNLQFTKISSKTRNGAYGLKGWINSN